MKAIFLDRDDTIIEDRIYLNDPNDIQYLPGTFEALSKLQEAGFKLLIVTNQSGVAKGLVQLENLHEIHRRIDDEMKKNGIEVSAYYYAPFDNDKPHPMRKPEPGMLNQGIEEFALTRKGSWMIGDRMSDVEAGHRAGLSTILLGSKESPNESEFAPPEGHFETLIQSVDFILRN